MRALLSLVPIIAVLALSLGATAPETPSTPAASAKTGEQTVVVTGRRPLDRPCPANDHACVLAVTAEIWRLYPQRVQDWCMKVQVNRERAQYNAGSSGGPNMGGDMPSTPFTSADPSVPEAERTLCNYKPQAH